jgi:hypothetical protein
MAQLQQEGHQFPPHKSRTAKEQQTHDVNIPQWLEARSSTPE